MTLGVEHRPGPAEGPGSRTGVPAPLPAPGPAIELRGISKAFGPVQALGVLLVLGGVVLGQRGPRPVPHRAAEAAGGWAAAGLEAVISNSPSTFLMKDLPGGGGGGPKGGNQQ